MTRFTLTTIIAFGAFFGGESAVWAKDQPYCPPVSQQAHQIYDIRKWCALINDDIRKGRRLDVLKRLNESRRHPIASHFG